jgi:hypothetical protein
MKRHISELHLNELLRLAAEARFAGSYYSDIGAITKILKEYLAEGLSAFRL